MILCTYRRLAIFLVGIFCVHAALFFGGNNNFAYAQDAVLELEQRVKRLEDYVETFQPTIIDLSDNINTSIHEYTKGLEASLENYSQKLQTNLDERVAGFDRKVVVLDPYSRKYRSIETNTGIFLIFIERVELIENGVRLHMSIGNPNYANYEDFQLNLIWGEKWNERSGIPYEQWQRSLRGTEYTFEGKIEKGKWNKIAVDLIPVEGGRIGYLECEMNVTSVELKFD